MLGLRLHRHRHGRTENGLVWPAGPFIICLSIDRVRDEVIVKRLAFLRAAAAGFKVNAQAGEASWEAFAALSGWNAIEALVLSNCRSPHQHALPRA